MSRPMNLHLRLALLAALAFHGEAFSEPPPASDPLSAHLDRFYDAIPLSADPGGAHLFVAVQINGVEGRMQVDSGCNSSNVRRGSLAKFHLTAEETGQVIYGLGGAQPAAATAVDRLDIGGRIALRQIRLDVVSGADLDPGSDGILGTDVWGGRSAILDFAHRRMYIPRASDGERPPMSKLATSAGYAAVPLRPHLGVLVFDAQVEGVPATLLLDTGAQQTLLDTSLAQRAELKLHATDTAGVGSGNLSRLSFACPSRLQLASVTLADLPCVVTDLGPMAQNGLNGLIGGEVLVRLRALLDLDGAALYLDAAPLDWSEVGVIPGRFPPAVAPAQLLADHALVFYGFRAGAPKILDPAAPDGRLRVRIPYVVREVLKDDGGVCRPGERRSVVVSFALGADAPARLTAALARREMAIVCLKAADDSSADAPPLETVLWPASPLRIEQLKSQP